MPRLTVFVVAALGTLAVASPGALAQTPRTLAVPGLEGSAVAIAGAARLADGGAIVVGTLGEGGRRRVIALRLRHDGTVDPGYGRGGLARVVESGGSRAVGVAADPGSGRAWVATGEGRRGSVRSLDGRGRRARRFGRGGIRRLGAAPVAIATGRGRVVVAYGDGCRGCRLMSMDARTGNVTARAQFGAADGLQPPGCAPASVTSLAVLSDGGVAIGAARRFGACPVRLVVRTAALAAAGGLRGAGALALPGVTQRTVVAGAAGSALDVCLAMQRTDGVALARSGLSDLRGAATGDAPPAALPETVVPGIAGSLVAVVPTGATGCAALVAGERATLVQAGRDGGAAKVTRLPPGVRAAALFRCRRHVLVLGVRRRGGRQEGVVSVVDLRGQRAQARAASA
ncbi:MAG: hypothetical protein H0T43_12620 [Solirubrobacterales bacterium]|nr:hypothetical protein [Solirubrobacterales bacterium]